MKRLLIVTDFLENIRGGAEKQIYLLSSGLIERGWQVDILVLQSECKDRFLFESKGIEVFVENIKRVYSSAGKKLACLWRKRIKERRYWAIFSYHFGSDLWLAMFIRGSFNGKIISMRRDDGFWMRPYHRLVYRWLINPRMDYVCAVSKSVAENIKKRQALKTSNLCVIPNGVELDRFTPGLGCKEKEGTFTVVYVANLSPIKNHDLVIRAVDILKDKIHHLRVLFVGSDRGYGDQLMKLVRMFGLEAVIEFKGKVESVEDILKDSDICLQVSLSEGMSNTLLEYMASGKPIIASDIMPNREVLGRAGVYVDPNNPQDLAGALLSLYSDVNTRIEIGRLARERVESIFSLDKMISRYIDLLEK